MLSKRSYFIKIQQANSLIRSAGKTISFSFKHADCAQALKFESQISDFVQFETALAAGLEKLSYQARPWNRNILYFSIPNGLDPVQTRCYFDAADHVGATASFLVHEHVAILLNPQFQELRHKTVLVVGVFNSKVEWSVIKDLAFEKKERYYGDAVLLNPGVTGLILNIISSMLSEFPIDEILVIDERNDSLSQRLIAGLPSSQLIKERDNLILSGLEIAATKGVEQVIGRLGL